MKDIFHLMDMVKVPKHHGVAKEFNARFRDTIFVVDEEDRRRVERYLEGQDVTFQQMQDSKPDWIHRRVRRVVPDKETLYHEVQTLFDTFGPMVCASSGKQLFDQESRVQANHVLEAIRAGHVSDPPGISFYFLIGHDKDGLPMYRCSRGTNSIEGGVHQNIIRKFGSFGASPELADCMLAEYRLRHNLDVSQMIM